MTETPTNVQYAPFASAVDPGFWQKLTEKKLNEYGLDESQQQVHGFFSNGTAPGLAAQMVIDYTAFNSEWKPPARNFGVSGILINTNTVDKFKETDKKALLNLVGRQMWEDIKNGSAVQDPDKLCRCVLLTFADLKKYHYYYWFAFPAFKFPDKVFYKETPVPLQEKISTEKISSLVLEYDKYQSSRPSYASFFLIVDNGDSYRIEDFAKIETLIQASQNLIIGVCDPSSFAGYPGWPVRNLLTLLTFRFSGILKAVTVLCVRDRTQDRVRDFGNSLLMTFDIPVVATEDLTDVPECVGWEKNERQKMGPRMVNLSSTMDPTRLAESAVDLNLKLMRWRLLPDLQLDKIASTRCLVLGSGTLGCNVARLLMGWGMRHITMVDNSKVSYSNPVRQSLFTFEHCLNGGQPKAQAAAESLKTIFPGMKSEGINLSIPMPGHTITDSVLEQTKEDVKTLEQLIDNHDVVFLLMDTRESRWLPTLIAGSKKKIVINAALGFDTFLVLRHGVKTGSSASSLPLIVDRIPGNMLGCYFCNDVVAPGNSTKDRTLDQQCTVTRPGISMVAASLAVELLVSILQHPAGGEAPAETSATESNATKEPDSSLGIVPHQIRGFLSRFQQILPASRAFDMCTACSSTVITLYEKEGFGFLLNVFNKPGFLEEVTGLSAMHNEAADIDVWGFSDDEEISSGPTSMEAESAM